MNLLFEIERRDPPILGFFDRYRFLSNYHICPCVVSNIKFISSEHAYMYQKSDNAVYREAIISCPTPKEAKRVGQTAELRRDWKVYRKTAMLIALNAKFKNKDVAQLLIDTGDSYLEETNTWNDTFWGVCKGVGENNLGKLLMKIRTNLKK